jgi:hypothetical protein
MKKFLNVVLVALTMSIALVACKKDDPVTVTACFADNYNGTYVGDLISGGVPSLGVSVKLTKTGCTTATIESSAFSTITINSLQASAQGGYSGTTSNNQSIAIALDRSTLSISGPIEFTGEK